MARKSLPNVPARIRFEHIKGTDLVATKLVAVSNGSKYATKEAISKTALQIYQNAFSRAPMSAGRPTSGDLRASGQVVDFGNLEPTPTSLVVWGQGVKYSIIQHEWINDPYIDETTPGTEPGWLRKAYEDAVREKWLEKNAVELLDEAINTAGAPVAPATGRRNTLEDLERLARTGRVR